MTLPRGVVTAIHTPFDSRWAVDLGAFQGLIEFQRAAGVTALVVGGTNGEGPSLSAVERKRLLETAVECARGMVVIAATGAANLPEAVDLTQHASSAGADAVLILPPFYFKQPTLAGLIAFFRTVLDASKVPALLYNIPQQSAVPITAELLKALSSHENLAGMKDSAGNWERTQELIVAFPKLAVYPGSDRHLTRALQAGAPGVVTGTANAFPDLAMEVLRRFESGADPTAAQERLDLARDLVLRYPIVAASKAVLGRRGLPRMSVRPPLVDLTSDQEVELFELLQASNLLEQALERPVERITR